MNASLWTAAWGGIFIGDRAMRAAWLILYVGIGAPLFYGLGLWARRVATKRFSAWAGVAAGRVVFFAGLALIALGCLRALRIDLRPLIQRGAVETALRCFVLLFVGVPAAYALGRWAERLAARRWSAQHGMIVGKAVVYTGLGLVLVSFLRQLQFEISPILGALGIVGVAVGFASQTSFSNIISGIFLIGERSFEINDVVAIGEVTGQVLSIDLMSVKLRTFDNRFVRIPNETIVKSQVTNVSRFPIRRVDINVSVAYKEDIGRVRTILLGVAHRNPLCLEEPEPLVIFSGFGASSIDLLVAAWAAKEDWMNLKNSLGEDILAAFRREGVVIPYPHLSLDAGEEADALSVRVTESDKAGTIPEGPRT
ncbi:MAG: mechanosensitive ion channel family protein [Candidatus Sumerlaeota bacterium]|nr:mechanosensitive ion channel family protein [Candidatus Sumerlaeota bacterium]